MTESLESGRNCDIYGQHIQREATCQVLLHKTVIFNPWEVEAGDLQVWDQPVLHKKNL